MAEPAEPALDPAADLDEDLFDFDEVMGSRLSAEEEEADLDEIFAAFDEMEDGAAGDVFGLADEEPDALDAAPAQPAGAPEEADLGEEAEELLALDESEPEPVLDLEPEPESELVFEPEPEPEVVQPPQRNAPRPAPPVARPTAVAAPALAPPAAVPAATVPARAAGGMRGALWILVAVTAMNSLVAMVSLKASGDTRNSMLDLGRELSLSAQQALQRTERGPATETDSMPLEAPDADAHPTFELAREEIARGEYAKARQRMYALLAIIDRLDPLVREELEARANYVLAEALHLEAVAQLEAER